MFLTKSDSMHNIDKFDIFSCIKDDRKYFLNDLSLLALKEGRVQIMYKIISLFGNDVSKDDIINVLCNEANDNLHDIRKSLTLLLSCMNSSSKFVSKYK